MVEVHEVMGSISTRVLYLHQSHILQAGQRSVLGRRLVEYLSSTCDQVLNVHAVVDNDFIARTSPAWRTDLISSTECAKGGFNVIYCEGGIESGFSREDGTRVWKLDRNAIEQHALNGGVVIIADIDSNFARNAGKDFYNLCHMHVVCSGQQSPVYFTDYDDTFRGSIRLTARNVAPRLSEWIRPIYNDCRNLFVDRPLELTRCQEALAFAEGNSVGTLCSDMWWSLPTSQRDNESQVQWHPDSPGDIGYWGPFASVRQLGTGFIVAITGNISGDYLPQEENDNPRWIGNMVKHLVMTARNNESASTIWRFRLGKVFLSHRSLDKPLVDAVARELRQCGLQVWLDKDEMLPSDSLGLAISGGLTDCNNFAIFWSTHCLGAKWVEFELGAAISQCVEHGRRILIVPLDATPVPAALSQYVRVEHQGTPAGIAASMIDAIVALAKRSSSTY
jgi:TIR domain